MGPARTIAKTIIPAVVVACALVLASCGTTQITTNERTARIYVNGSYAGKGETEIRRRGTPGTARILVEAPDGRRESKTIKRRFTATTFVFGLFTYMVGWAIGWEYPAAVIVPLEAPQRPAAGWDSGNSDDLWLSPPPGWTQPPAPATQDAPPAPAPEGSPWQ